MIEWFSYSVIALAVVATLVSAGFAIAGSPPNDYTLGLTALLGLALLAQVVITILLQLAGGGPTGDIVEFWAYLATAVVLAPAAIGWGLIERSRWATIALAVLGFSLAVMVYRMHEIWFVQVM